MDISKYRDNIELSDITVVVDDKEFKLHKFPLSICSEYFKNECKNEKSIVLRNFPGGKDNFEIIADHFYGKDVELSANNVILIVYGAEFLDMNGKNNLVDKCEKFIDRVFRSAEYSKSLETLIGLVELSPEMETRKDELQDKVLNLILQLWLRNFSNFKSNIKEHYLEDSLIYDSLISLDHIWIIKLLKKCNEDTTKHFYIGRLAVDYIKYSILDKISKPSTVIKKRQKISSLNSVDDEIVNGNASDCDSEHIMENGSDDHHIQNDDSGEDDKLVGAFNEVIMALPDNVNVGQHISVEWLKDALELCDRFHCRCRSRLLQVCGDVLTRVSMSEVRSLDPAALKALIDETLNADDRLLDRELVRWIWDHHLLELTKTHQMDAAVFYKVVTNMPEGRELEPGVVFEIVLSMLTNKESSPPDVDSKRSELLACVELARLSPDNLEAALQSGLWDPQQMCTVLIDRLRQLQPPSRHSPGPIAGTETYRRPLVSSRVGSRHASPVSPYRSNWQPRRSPLPRATITSAELFSNVGDDSANCWMPSYHSSYGPVTTPTTGHYRSNYSSDIYLSLEESLRYELKNISDSYSKYHRDRVRSRSRKRYNYY